MAKVFITVCNTQNIHKNVVYVLWNLALYEKRHQLRLELPTHTPYENNLSHCLRDFLRTDEDYWLNIDSDNPPERNPLDLIGLDLDLVGCPTPVFHFDIKDPVKNFIYHNVYKKRKEGGFMPWPIMKGLQEVDAVGTGCFLVSRRLFQRMDLRKKPFERLYYDDGTVKQGNDLTFCDKVKAEGFKIYAHFDYPCNHHVTIPLNDVLIALAAQKEVLHG